VVPTPWLNGGPITLANDKQCDHAVGVARVVGERGGVSSDDVDVLAAPTAASDRPNPFFEAVAAAVAQTSKTRRALDSTVLDDAVTR
jgi:hypothetical protein